MRRDKNCLDQSEVIMPAGPSQPCSDRDEITNNCLTGLSFATRSSGWESSDQQGEPTSFGRAFDCLFHNALRIAPPKLKKLHDILNLIICAIVQTWISCSFQKWKIGRS